MLDRIRKLLRPRPSRKKRIFGSLQIEATSECFLRCIMCPRTAHLGKWHSGFMSFSTFEKISGYFSLAEHVHLQGWGEPLLHKRIFDMIKLAKDAGCRVGFTTNGMLLSEKVSERIVDLEVDIIGISIAGASPEVHGSIRVNSPLTKLTTNIGNLVRVKRRTESKKPKIVLSFLMTRSNIHELPDAVALAYKLGVDELVATNLDYPSTELQDRIKVFSCDKANQDYANILKKAESKAKSFNLSFRFYPLKTEEVLMCELNPVSYVYISYDGLVSPCVYLNQTREEDFPRIFCGKKFTVKRTTFGDVNREGLLEIWDKPEYRAFRDAYIKRQEVYYEAFGDIPFDFGFSEKIKEVESRALKALKQAPLPGPCRTCYKAYGI